MGGKFSEHFKKFSKLCVEALIVARRHVDDICSLMEIMMHKSEFPSFKYNPRAIRDFRNRLFLDVSDADIELKVNGLISRWVGF